MKILGLDTSGKTASVAILDTEKKLFLGEHTVYTNRTHSQVIMPMCKNLLTECGLTIKEIDGIAVAVGPGSYTGLRIGIAAVQGMAMANNTPCQGVSTLEALAFRLYQPPVILPLMYARNNLFYTAQFNWQYDSHFDFPERMSSDELMTVSEIAEMIAYEPEITLTGDGAEEFIRQYQALNLEKPVSFRIAPAHLKLQSAAGVCACAAEWQSNFSTPFHLTASYLQAVQIQKKKTDK